MSTNASVIGNIEFKQGDRINTMYLDGSATYLHAGNIRIVTRTTVLNERTVMHQYYDGAEWVIFNSLTTPVLASPIKCPGAQF